MNPVARLHLKIDHEAPRLTLKAMMEAEGHIMSSIDVDAVLSDDIDFAIRASQDQPTIVLTTANEIPRAVAAMKKGVYGYIFIPLQAGEAQMMVERALDAKRSEEPSLLEIAPLEQIETEHILRVLRMCKHNQAKAARILCIGRNTLWRKLKKIRSENEELIDVDKQ